MLSGIENALERFSQKTSLPVMTLLTGLPMIMFSCNQTLALMLQVPLIRPIYEKRGISHEKLMLDLSDTTVLLSGLVPWCLACSMPLEMLNASPACLPFSFFLYLPALTVLVREIRRSGRAGSGA